MPKQTSMKILAQNRQAYHEYFVFEKFEAGIELSGTEVKSMRMGQINLRDSYCSIDGLELFIKGMNISPYEKGNIFNLDSMRARRLLMHKKEILRLHNLVMQDGNTLIPLSIYLKGPIVKIEIGLCKGKKLYDKRESIAKHDAERNIRRELSEKNRM